MDKTGKRKDREEEEEEEGNRQEGGDKGRKEDQERCREENWKVWREKAEIMEGRRGEK